MTSSPRKIVAALSIFAAASFATYLVYKRKQGSVKSSEPCIIFITGNQHKLSEFKTFLSDNVSKYVFNRVYTGGIAKYVTHQDIDLDEVQELSPNKVIRQKCYDALNALRSNPKINLNLDINKTLIIVEDVSLFLSEYENEIPGPLIKWFIPKISKTQTSCKYILKMLKHDNANRNATAMCMYGCIPLNNDDNNDSLQIFEGISKGIITDEEIGDGFGFSPIFKPNGYDITFAQMSKEQKYECSHRANALKKLNRYLTQWIVEVL